MYFCLYCFHVYLDMATVYELKVSLSQNLIARLFRCCRDIDMITPLNVCKPYTGRTF